MPSYVVAWNWREPVSTTQSQLSRPQLPEIVRLGAERSLSHFIDIARLHADEIHHGILPRLGIRFLGTLYKALARAPQTGVWAAFDDGRIVGFLTGCGNVRRTYRWVLARPAIWVRLGAAAPAVWRLGMRRLLSPFTYVRGRTMDDDDDAHAMESACIAELLSLAVRPEARGRGVATALVTAFEIELRRWDVSDCYRVATNITDLGSNRFYGALGFSPRGTVRHHDLVLQIYEKHLEPRAPKNRETRLGDRDAW